MTNAQWMDGLESVPQVLAALKNAISAGQVLTDLQVVEAKNRIDLIKRQCDFLSEDL